MISNIEDVLNFRSHRKFLLKKWHGGECPKIFLDYKELLQETPSVCHHFKYILNRDFGIHINNQSKNNDVFCDAGYMNLLNKLTNKYPDSFNNLVIMGKDKHLSVAFVLLESIRHRFKKIYYEAKDVECNWVRTLPMGMIMAYMIRNGGNNILPHINKQKKKTKLAASAFGSKYPKLTELIEDRANLKVFTKKSHFVEDMFCDPLEYYERLCEYKFFLAPLGNGIQTPKICECIMCETVPVVTDHVAHRELKDIYGLPLLIVNQWDDLTEQFLNDQWSSVYSKVDWSEQKSKFLVENFNKLLKRGE